MMQYAEVEPTADSLNSMAAKGWRLVCTYHPDALRHPAQVVAIMERERPKRKPRKKVTNGPA